MQVDVDGKPTIWRVAQVCFFARGSYLVRLQLTCRLPFVLVPLFTLTYFHHSSCIALNEHVSGIQEPKHKNQQNICTCFPSSPFRFVRARRSALTELTDKPNASSSHAFFPQECPGKAGAAGQLLERARPGFVAGQFLVVPF